MSVFRLKLVLRAYGYSFKDLLMMSEIIFGFNKEFRVYLLTHQ